MWNDRRWPRIVLAVSLLMNVFLIGVIAGHGWTDRRPPALRPGPGAPGGLRIGSLPPDDKHAFAASMRAYHETIEAKRSVLKTAKAALETAIAAPVYDRATVAAAFAEVRRASAESQDATQTALVEALATLSPAARAHLVSDH